MVVLYCLNCGDNDDHQFTRLNFGKLIPDDEYDHAYENIDKWGFCVITDNLEPEHDAELNWFRIIMGLKNVNFFLVFYMICWVGVNDVAKLEVLKNNRRMGANLYMTMLALQQIV